MNTTTMLSLLAAGPLFAAAPAAAQGAELDAGRQDAVRMKTPAFVRAEIGPKAVLLDLDGGRLGTVRDHVIETESGKVASFVVQVGPERAEAPQVLVPFERLTLDATTNELRLGMTLQELGTLPAYDRDSLEILGARPREASAAQKAPKAVLASEVLHGTLAAGSTQVGEIKGLLIQPKAGRVGFALIGKHEAPVVVPWRAMKWTARPETARAAAGTESKPLFLVTKPLEELAAAPTLEKGDPKKLDAKLLEAIGAFWGVETERGGAHAPSNG